MAIKYPDKVEAFNLAPINAKDELLWWNSFLGGMGKPRWIFTKGPTAKQESGGKKKFSEAELKKYCEHEEISMRDFAGAVRFFPEYVEEELKDFAELKKTLENKNE